MNRWRASIVQRGMLKLKFFHHPETVVQYNISPSSKSTLQCPTASSYKMTLSHHFLEGSTPEAAIKVAESWFWGVPVTKFCRSTKSEWWSAALSYFPSSSDSGSESNVYFSDGFCTGTYVLTFTLLIRRIWWAPNNASKWQMGFNSAFKELI